MARDEPFGAVEKLVGLVEVSADDAIGDADALEDPDAVERESAEAAEPLTAIVDSVAQFELYDKEFTLDHLAAELALGGVSGAPTASGGVKVASLHRTKGLQWKHVYLVGLEDGHLPDYRATAETMQEERRLCFVGVSRAEDRLIVTRAKATRGHLQHSSRFLGEMGLT